MGLALGAIAIGTVVNTIQIQVINSEVSKIGKELAKLEKRASNNKKHALDLMSKIGKQVGLNSVFDSMD